MMDITPNQVPGVCMALEPLPLWPQGPALTIGEGIEPPMPSSAVIIALQILPWGWEVALTQKGQSKLVGTVFQGNQKPFWRLCKPHKGLGTSIDLGPDGRVKASDWAQFLSKPITLSKLW